MLWIVTVLIVGKQIRKTRQRFVFQSIVFICLKKERKYVQMYYPRHVSFHQGHACTMTEKFAVMSLCVRWQRSCLCVSGVRGHVFVCQGSEVMYLCVRGQRSCICVPGYRFCLFLPFDYCILELFRRWVVFSFFHDTCVKCNSDFENSYITIQHQLYIKKINRV